MFADPIMPATLLADAPEHWQDGKTKTSAGRRVHFW
jgi:hypothetical protein